MKWYPTIFLLSLSALSAAAPLSYECNITGEYIQASDGELKPDEKVYFGKHFNVERSTGVVLGGGVGNSAYPVKQILDPGGKEQAFKLISVSKDIVGTDAGRNVVYLSISEYEEGSSKPFVLFEGSRVLIGACE